MSDFLKRYVDSAGIDPNDPALPQTIQDRLTGADAPGYHTGQDLDVRRLGRSWGEKTASAVTQDLYGQRHLVAALGNYLAGDKEDGLARLKRWEENNQRVREIGPEAQDFEEIKDLQSGASVIGYQTAKLIPDMLLGLGVGGLAKKALTTTATTAAAKFAAKEIAESAAAKEAKEALAKAGLEKLKDTAGYKAADAAKRAALERGRLQQIREQTDGAALDAARKNLSPEALKAIKAKGDTAFAIGATIGSIPSNLQEQGNFMVKNPDLDRDEALKLLAGTTAAASTDFIPLAGWLNRFSKKSIDASRAADKFVTRLAKAVAGQAASEGSQEVVQAMITRRSQQWVDENINMFDQEAMQEYYMNFIAGAVMGGVMGGGAETSISTAKALDSAFTSVYKKLEAQRLRSQNNPNDPSGGNPPPVDPSSPTSNVASAAAAAQASGRTLNPIAADVLQNDTGGDLGSQIKFSQVADQQAMDALNEFKNRVKNYRAGKTDIANAYDNDTSQELFPVGIRLDEEALPFANIAAGFGFTGFQGNAFDLKSQEAYAPGMQALESIMRYGYDSTEVSDEQRTAYKKLTALAPEPWRFSAVTALRSLNPTLHSDILSSVDDRLAKADQDLVKAEANLADSSGGQPVDSVTAPLNSEEGGNSTDDNMVGANPDAVALSNNIAASQLNQGLTAETTANALAKRLSTASNADLLLSSEFEPVVLKNVFGNPGVVAKLGGNKAISDAYAKLQSIADQRARMMARNAENLDRADAAKKKAQIDKRIELMISEDPILRKIANGVRTLAQQEADALVTKETAKNSGLFKKTSNQAEFDARVSGEFGEAPYVQTQNPDVLIDLDNQMRRFAKSPDGKEERMYIEGKNPEYDLANMAGSKNEQTNDPVGATITEQNSLQMLARLATNPQLQIDWSKFDWNATGTADGTPIRFREKADTRKAKREKRKEAAKKWAAEQKAENTSKARENRASQRAELAEKAADAKKNQPPPNKKGVSYNSTGVDPDELKDTENQDYIQINNGDLASKDPTTGKIVISELQKYNLSGFADDIGESYNPNAASVRMEKMLLDIRNESEQADVLRFFASFKNPDGTLPFFNATQFRWSESANGWVVFQDKEQIGKVSRDSLNAKQLKYLENPALIAFKYVADDPNKQSIVVPADNRPKTKIDRNNLIREILINAISSDASPRSIAQQTKKINAMTADDLDAALEQILKGKYDTGRNKVVEEQPQKFKDVTKKSEFDEDPSSADDIRDELFNLAEEVGATKKAVYFILSAAERAGTAKALKTSQSRLAAGVEAVREALAKIKNKAYRDELSVSIARMAGKLPPGVNKKAIVEAQGTPASFEIVKPENADVSGMRFKGKNITNTEPNENGWLGNPFVADDVNPNSKYTRGKATEAFEKVFLKRIADDPKFKEAVLALRGKKVGYYAPNKEHVHLRVVQKWLADQPLPGQQAKPSTLVKSEKAPSLPRVDPKERASLQKSDTLEKTIQKKIAEAVARKKASAIANAKTFVRSQDPVKVQAMVKEALVEAKPNELQRLLSAWLSKRWSNTHGAAPVFKVAKKDQQFKNAPMRDKQAETPRAKGELESQINTAKQRLVEFNIRQSEKAPKVDKPVNDPGPRNTFEEEDIVRTKKMWGKLVTTKRGQQRVARVAARRTAYAAREQRRRGKMSPLMQQLETAWRNYLENQAVERAKNQPKQGSTLLVTPTDMINALNATGFSEATRIAGLLEKALRTLPKSKETAMMAELEAAWDELKGSDPAVRNAATDAIMAKYYPKRNDLYQRVFNRYKDEIEFALSQNVTASMPEYTRQTKRQARDERATGRKRLVAARTSKLNRLRELYSDVVPSSGMQFDKDGTPATPAISPVKFIAGLDPAKPLAETLEANDPELKASVAADWEQRPITDAEQKKTVAAYVKGMANLIGAKGAEALVKSGAVNFVTRDNLPPFASHIGNGVQAYEYEGKIYILADAPVGNVAGVLLHESFHAFGKSLLGEDYIPLLTELSRIAGVAAPVARTSTVMESVLGQRLPMTDSQRAVFDQALNALPKAEQDALKNKLNSALQRKDQKAQKKLITEVFTNATDVLYKAAQKKNIFADVPPLTKEETDILFFALKTFIGNYDEYSYTFDSFADNKVVTVDDADFEERVENYQARYEAAEETMMGVMRTHAPARIMFQENAAQYSRLIAAFQTVLVGVNNSADSTTVEKTYGYTATLPTPDLANLRNATSEEMTARFKIANEIATAGSRYTETSLRLSTARELLYWPTEGLKKDENFASTTYATTYLATKDALATEKWKEFRTISASGVAAAIKKLAMSQNTSLESEYNRVLNETMQQFVVYTTDDGGTWRLHKQAKDGTPDSDAASMSVQVNSHTNWCIKNKSMADSYLSKGDIWTFSENTGKPRLAVRFVGDRIAEIQEPANDKTVSPKGQNQLADLVRAGLLDKNTVLDYAKDWGLTTLVELLGNQADIATAQKKAGLAADARENGMAMDDDGNALDVALADYRGEDDFGDEYEVAELAAAGLRRAPDGRILPDDDDAFAVPADEQAYPGADAERQGQFNDVPFSVAANADDLRAVVDRDWISKAKLRIELAGVKPEHQAEEFAAYAIENYESAPNNIQKWIDKLLGKMKLALATMLRKLKVAPKYRVALLSDPAVLREIALKGLRVAARRSEGHTNFGAGSIAEDLAVTAQAAVTRVFGAVYGSVQSERIAAGAQQFATSPTRGYKDPGRDPDELLKLDVHNLNEFLNRALTPGQRQALYQLAHTTFRETIRALQPELYSKMLSNEYGREYTMYYLFQAYMGGALGEQSEIRGFYLLNKAKAKAREFLDIYTEDDLALQVLRDMSDGTLVNAAKSAYPYDPELRLKRNQSKAGSISQKVTEATAKAADVFERAFYSDYDRARSSGIPAYEEIVNRLQYRAGDRLEKRADGTVNRGMLPAVQHNTGKYLQMFEKAVEGLPEESVTRVVYETYYNLPEPRPGKLTPAETEAFYKHRDVLRKLGAYGVDGKVLTAEQVANNPDFAPLVFDVSGDVASHKQKLFEMFFQHTKNAKGKLSYKYEEMIDGLYVMKNPAKAGETQTHFDKLSFEQQKAFVRSVAEYPFFDPSEVMLDDQLGREFRHASHRLFTEVFANYKKGDTADLDVLVSTLEPSLGEQAVRYIEPLVVRAEFNKAFPGNKAAELIQEMVDQGATPIQVNAAGRIIDAAQHKFTFYPLDKQGRKGSPTIAKLNKTLAIKLHNRATLTAIQNISAWNNLRMLPLSLLSSLVDPQGIAIRSGGDLGVAFTALRKGLAATFDSKAQAELHAMADAAGYHAELSAAQALHEGFGAGSRTPLARKVNSFLFKWNGLEWYTRQSRFMGLIAGHLVLAKWQEAARDPNTTPEKQAQIRRYFDELGLNVDDVRVGILSDGPLAGQKQALLLNDEQRKNATPEQLAADDRVKGALVQFTDEALLRPNILQTPGYFKDPFVSLFVQYKHFSYALFEQIVRRMQIELANGNYAVLNAALSYLPFILLAELLREFIQWGPEGNPQRNQWGVAEYTGLAVAKTGFAGPRVEYAASIQRDAERGNVPGVSALGPTVGTLGEIKDSATGQRSWGSTLQSLAPGSAVYKRWDDEPSGGAGLARKPTD